MTNPFRITVTIHGPLKVSAGVPVRGRGSRRKRFLFPRWQELKQKDGKKGRIVQTTVNS